MSLTMNEERLVEIGEKKLRFTKLENIGETELICDTRCPYSKNCFEFPDPRGIEGSCFEDFCACELDLYVDQEEANCLIPALGSLEMLKS